MTVWMKRFQGNTLRACAGYVGPRLDLAILHSWALAFCTAVLGFLQGQGAYYLGMKTLQGI